MGFADKQPEGLRYRFRGLGRNPFGGGGSGCAIRSIVADFFGHRDGQLLGERRGDRGGRRHVATCLNLLMQPASNVQYSIPINGSRREQF